ncbi:vesicle transport protein SEC20-like [Liolophura sinensis]|uniref:vesicle transport protein SEC20-like n=1 Tax=Liolophura sinensis TaxID=3198878 RepID=UPI003158DFE5
MAAEDVRVRVCLQEIVKLQLEITAFIQDIRECDGPLDRLMTINSEVRENLGNLKSKLQDLERMGNEQDKESDKQTILRDVQNHRKSMASTIVSLRQANLMANLAIDKKEKEDLLKGSTDVRKRNINNKESLVSSANSITESLMSLSKMMSGQVVQSQDTISSLESSSNTITGTREEFRSMSGHIQNSRKLLTKYNRREVTDKLLIFLALVFFFSTVLYIVKKRIWS